jgi:hypothetical protein
VSASWQWARSNPDAAARRIRELERENVALRQAAVELAAIGRVWVTVWGDQLSGDSVRRFGELEQQILKEAP